MAKILIVDDEIGIRELLSEILRDEGHDILLAENAAAARAARNALRPDMVLLDIWMPDTDGITLLKEWAANGQLNMPVVMMSGHGTIDTAVEATRIGAIDYLEKPIALQKLLAAVKRGLQRPQAPGAPAPLTLSAFTRSVPLRELKRRVEQISGSSRVLLLRVGSGSLAELVARSVQPGNAPWLDLGAVSAPLDLSQLQATQGGVLFVSELARLSRAQQKNLAFALDRLERYDLRLVVATERNLEGLVAEGWEEGLLSRLFEVSLAPPSLAEVRDDLPELASQLLLHLIEGGDVPLRRLSTAALNQLRNLPWPGGYAELRAAVKSLALGTLEEEIGAGEVRRLLPPDLSTGGCGVPLDQPLREAREAFERLYFEHHLRLEGGNMTRLAEKTGLERTHLYRKLKQLGLQAGRRHEEG
ncbi:sigma-54-dependent transcriptional regulator [Thauera mechernichensis]|mgnify:CR=1 FL=1|uniref:Sigma-54-dependent transcriptional regulator n=1 Tax=Thauera mechernichensis TaxID=82788 RepID=A0ABW3WI88_9RHOO|nr:MULTISPECIES: response regulator [Thauera]ENO82806.1 two component sigma-54 specific Fis family transcriptional regulator [Thauera sp. 27]ENO93702.1 two component sigma-54 specific Fis family transcriptional regulator [Thauera sp. 28]MDG3065243.1 response regulator [Thauera mechernichensis]WBL64236.1 response regulator [Thauera sp. WB-2]HAG74260.1 sigma-54-dependent Fis family transcriptional regulator [Thauera sp.]